MPTIKTEIIGPFSCPEYSYAVIDGYKVPYIKLLPGTGENDGKLSIVLDDRMSFIFDDAGHVDTMLALLANAMAVAAGYSCFGKNSVKDPNPFQVRMGNLADFAEESDA